MATHKIAYAAVGTVTISLASLATSATFVAGQESAVVDNSTNLYDDVILGGVIRVGTTPTVNTQILVFAFAPYDLDAPTYPDVMDGTDSVETLTSVGIGQGFLRLAAALSVDATTSNRDYYFSGVSLASVFGGTLPKKWSLFVAHNTGVNLNATGGQHVIKYTGVNYTIA